MFLKMFLKTCFEKHFQKHNSKVFRKAGFLKAIESRRADAADQVEFLLCPSIVHCRGPILIQRIRIKKKSEKKSKF